MISPSKNINKKSLNKFNSGFLMLIIFDYEKYLFKSPSKPLP